MEKPSRALIVAIALVLLLGLALHLSFWLDAVCISPSRRPGIKAGGYSCFEFWLNRYQSLVGNIITAAVAGATLLWFGRQLDLTSRQTAVISAQALRVRAGELEQEQEICRNADKIREDVAKLIAPPDAFLAVSEAGSSIIEAVQKLAEAIRPLMNSANADYDSAVAGHRRAMIDAVSEMVHEAVLAVDAFRKVTKLTAPDAAPWRAGLDNAWSNLRTAENNAKVAGNSFNAAIHFEAAETWRRIREFEALAVARH